MINTIEDIFNMTSLIEDLLKSKGATGSGLKDLRLSIEDKLSAECHNHLKYIGHIRNQVAHEGYKPTVKEYANLNELYKKVLDELKPKYFESTDHINLEDAKDKLIFINESFKNIYDITCQIYSSKASYMTAEKKLAEVNNNDVIKKYKECTFEIDDLAKEYCKIKGWAIVRINGEKTKLSYDVVTLLLERERLIKWLQKSRADIIEESIQRESMIAQFPPYLLSYLSGADSNELDKTIFDINKKFKKDDSINITNADIVAGILTVAFGLFISVIK
ncbi:TPA: hypothetical protein R8G72_004497 [Citrobacter youngae]|nr:hypothetical protein [Citrobacter youngae]HEF0074338.1 hypothetical protein [Citrobacter youngae]